MFFEGSEKKVEVVVSPGTSLRSLGDEFWNEVVECARAKVLSKISNEHCDAYLLSESSLFVWDEQFVMLTCGTTTLMDSILRFLDEVSLERVQTLFYERKNEYFPHHQKSDFYEDYRRLRERAPVKAYRFGDADEHHLFLLHLDKAYSPNPRDCTLELLMYDLQGVAKDVFGQPGRTLDEVRDKTGVHRIFPDFKVDDFLFSPIGYSLNGIRGTDYYTIHVTPQELGAYVSFETNIELGSNVQNVVNEVLGIFKPRSFDVVLFRPADKDRLSFPSYYRKRNVRERVSCGYEIDFSYYYTPTEDVQSAYEIVEEESQ